VAAVKIAFVTSTCSKNGRDTVSVSYDSFPYAPRKNEGRDRVGQ
jgi:hypothetical protein